MAAKYEFEKEIQKIYIAYYGRAADPEGQDFWAQQLEAAGGDLYAIVDAFGNSEEFQNTYGEQEDRDLVNNLFQQLFGRDADAEGLEFYVGLLQSGGKSLASISLDILNGALNSDQSIIDNKLQYVEEFTLKIKVKNKGYDDSVAVEVKARLKGISDDDDSRDSAIAELETLVDDLPTATSVYFDEEEGDGELEVASDALITVDDNSNGTLKLLLTDEAETIVINDAGAKVRLFGFGAGDRVVLSNSLLDDTDLSPVIDGTERSIGELLVLGGATEQAAQDIEAFLTNSKQNRISLDIERETEALFSIKLRIDTAEGDVRIHDILVDAAALAELGFDLDALDEEEFYLKRSSNEPESIKVNADDDDSDDDDSDDSDDDSDDES